jgi:hypothetical protein
MRAALALAVLTGCAQVFGLSDPERVVGDASQGDTPDAEAADAADAAPVIPCDATATQLVGCFDFEGSVVDGSASGTPVVQAINIGFLAGREGMALRGESGSMVTLAYTTAFDTPSYTIQAWINPSELPLTGLRAGVWDINARTGVFVMSDGSIMSRNMTTGAATIAPNVWTHVAVTDDQMTLRFYVNGTLTATFTSGLISPANAGAEIGGNAPSGDRFIGLIDSLRIYSVVRTAQQIADDAGAP